MGKRKPPAIPPAIVHIGPPQPGTGGRPTVLTPEVRTIILTAISLGSYRQVAAQMAGIDPSTLSRWMQREDEPYASFAAEVAQIEAATEVNAVARLSQAGNAALVLAWLERRHKDRWSTRLESTGKEGGPIQIDVDVDVSTLTDEQLAILAGRPARGPQGQGGAGDPSAGTP